MVSKNLIENVFFIFWLFSAQVKIDECAVVCGNFPGHLHYKNVLLIVKQLFFMLKGMITQILRTVQSIL